MARFAKNGKQHSSFSCLNSRDLLKKKHYKHLQSHTPYTARIARSALTSVRNQTRMCQSPKYRFNFQNNPSKPHDKAERSFLPPRRTLLSPDAPAEPHASILPSQPQDIRRKAPRQRSVPSTSCTPESSRKSSEENPLSKSPHWHSCEYDTKYHITDIQVLTYFPAVPWSLSF